MRATIQRHYFTRTILPVFSLLLGVSLCLALPTSASATSTSSIASPVPTRSELENAISRLETFAEYPSYATLNNALTTARSGSLSSSELAAAIVDVDPNFTYRTQSLPELIYTAENLPFVQEYTYLRTLTQEMSTISANYAYVSTSDEAWKISYLIERSTSAIKGCTLLFGLNRTESAPSTQDIIPANPHDAYATTPYPNHATPSADSSPSLTAPENNTASFDSTIPQDSTEATINPDTEERSLAATNSDQTSSSGVRVAVHVADVGQGSGSETASVADEDSNPEIHPVVTTAAHIATTTTALGALALTNKTLRRPKLH